jgi:hypothetical protein
LLLTTDVKPANILDITLMQLASTVKTSSDADNFTRARTKIDAIPLIESDQSSGQEEKAFFKSMAQEQAFLSMYPDKVEWFKKRKKLYDIEHFDVNEELEKRKQIRIDRLAEDSISKIDTEIDGDRKVASVKTLTRN